MLGLGLQVDVSGWRRGLFRPVVSLLLAKLAGDTGADATVTGGSGNKKLRRTNGATGVQTLLSTFPAGGTRVFHDAFAAAVFAVDVSPASPSVEVGSTVQLTATPKDVDGNPLLGRAVTWLSGDESIATVSNWGLVTGRSAGSATITATCEGVSGTAGVAVTAPV